MSRPVWGSVSRHCVYCGKVGPRMVVAFGYAHKRCLPAEALRKMRADDAAAARARADKEAELAAANRTRPQKPQGIFPPDHWAHGAGTSPLMLAQERVSRDMHYPWRVLVVCALLNQTQGRQVRPMLGELLDERCPTPDFLMLADVSDLLRPLGLQERRASLLRRMTWDYLAGRQPWECHGAGEYARDALALFVDGRLDIRPRDHWLRPYWDWRMGRGYSGGHRAITWDRAGHSAWRKANGFAPLKRVPLK